jgi:hypothetical protein
MRHLIFLVLVLLGFSSLLSAQAPVVADAHVIVGSNINNGASKQLQLNVAAGNKVPASDVYIRLDLSRLPAGATADSVVKSTLRLNVLASSVSLGTFDVYMVMTPWNEAIIADNNRPVVGPQVFSAVNVTQRGGYLLLDITGPVKAWLSGAAANHGLLLTASPGSAISVFLDSKEGGGRDAETQIDYTDQVVLDSLTSLDGRLNQEALDRQNADSSTLAQASAYTNAQVTSEAAERGLQDFALQNALTGEITRATAAEGALTGQLSNKANLCCGNTFQASQTIIGGLTLRSDHVTSLQVVDASNGNTNVIVNPTGEVAITQSLQVGFGFNALFRVDKFGNVFANKFAGDGSALTNLNVASVAHAESADTATTAASATAAQSATSAITAENALRLGGVLPENYARLDAANVFNGPTQKFISNISIGLHGTAPDNWLNVGGNTDSTAGAFVTNHNTSTKDALIALHTGRGNAFHAQNTQAGGRAGLFEGTHPLSTAATLESRAAGMGAAIFASSSNGNGTAALLQSGGQIISGRNNANAEVFAVNSLGQVTAATFTGDGSALTNVTAANATNANFATTAGNANDSAQLGGVPAISYARLDRHANFVGDVNAAGRINAGSDTTVNAVITARQSSGGFAIQGFSLNSGGVYGANLTTAGGIGVRGQAQTGVEGLDAFGAAGGVGVIGRSTGGDGMHAKTVFGTALRLFVDDPFNRNGALLRASKNGTEVFAVAGDGTLTATKLIGDGSGLTNLPMADLGNLNASNLTSGTLPDSRLSGNVPLLQAGNLTISGIYSGNGSGLTNLSATNLSGAIAVANLPTGVALINSPNIFREQQSIVGPSEGFGLFSTAGIAVYGVGTAIGIKGVGNDHGISGDGPIGIIGSGSSGPGVWGQSSLSAGIRGETLNAGAPGGAFANNSANCNGCSDGSHVIIGERNGIRIFALRGDQGGSMELGGTSSNRNPILGGTPYIDFHYGNDLIEDFNVRLINDGNRHLSIFGDVAVTGPLQAASLKAASIQFPDGSIQSTASQAAAATEKRWLPAGNCPSPNSGTPLWSGTSNLGVLCLFYTTVTAAYPLSDGHAVTQLIPLPDDFSQISNVKVRWVSPDVTAGAAIQWRISMACAVEGADMNSVAFSSVFTKTAILNAVANASVSTDVLPTFNRQTCAAGSAAYLKVETPQVGARVWFTGAEITIQRQ